MKKVIALLLALTMVVTMLAACGGSGSDTTTAAETTAAQDETTAADGGDATEETTEETTEAEPEYEINYDSTITVGASTDIGSMNQFGATSPSVSLKKLLCYETLFYKNPDGELLPLLAKEYTTDGDGTYDIELFDYIYDSQGNHMTAADIVFSFEQLTTQASQSDLWATATVEATGDYSVRLVANPEATGQVGKILTRVSMITEAAYNNSPDALATEPIGTGGYVLDQSRSITGASYTFTRRDDYWQTDEEYINERNTFYLKDIVCKIYTDVSTLATGLETGEIDITSDLDTEALSFFTDGENAYEGFIQLQDENNSFPHLLFNCAETSPCHDLKLRQAICYAIDAAACAYQVFGSQGQVCMAPTNPNLDDSGEEFFYDEYFDYDVDKAKELVAESSYNGETIRILVLPRFTVSGCAVLIQNYLISVGINSELLEYDMSVYRTMRVEADPQYDIEMMGATAGDSHVYSSLKELNANSYEAGVSRIMIQDDKLQELFDQVATQKTNSPEAVKALFDYITDECYVYGLYYCPDTVISKDNLVVHACTFAPFFGPLYNSFVIQ